MTYAVATTHFEGYVDLHIVKNKEQLISLINTLYNTDRIDDIDDYNMDELYDINSEGINDDETIQMIKEVETNHCIFSMM